MEKHTIDSEFIRHEALAAFERVWETAVAIPILSCVDTLNCEPLSEPWLGAVAWIGGCWTGNVQLVVDRIFAQHLTRSLFMHAQVESEEVCFDNNEVFDALRELANMVAGNLKASLPGVCGLATPGNFVVDDIRTISQDFPCALQKRFTTEFGTIIYTVAALI